MPARRTWTLPLPDNRAQRADMVRRRAAAPADDGDAGGQQLARLLAMKSGVSG